MIRRPTGSTRTYTLFPYPTLFRSYRIRPEALLCHARDRGRQLAAAAHHGGRCVPRLRSGTPDLGVLYPGRPDGSARAGRARRAASRRSFLRLLLREHIGHHAAGGSLRSEEHTSELQSLMRISYAVLCLKKKTKIITTTLAKHKKQQHIN